MAPKKRVSASKDKDATPGMMTQWLIVEVKMTSDKSGDHGAATKPNAHGDDGDLAVASQGQNDNNVL